MPHRLSGTRLSDEETVFQAALNRYALERLQQLDLPLLPGQAAYVEWLRSEAAELRSHTHVRESRASATQPPDSLQSTEIPKEVTVRQARELGLINLTEGQIRRLIREGKLSARQDPLTGRYVLDRDILAAYVLRSEESKAA
jgi:hypothetical protein